MVVDEPESFGPLVVIEGDQVLLRGWRSLSTTSLLAIGLPIIVAILAFLAGGWWIWIGVAAGAFAVFGVFVIFQSAVTRLKFEPDGVRIDGSFVSSSQIANFAPSRDEQIEGIDDRPGATELLLVMRDGTKRSLAAMSGTVDIEKLAAWLSTRVQA